MNLEEIDTIVISGGGVKILSFLGSIKYIFKNTKMNRKQIKNYIGTSAGAILSFYLILNYTLEEIETIFLNLDIATFDVKYDIDKLFTNLGMIKENVFTNIFKHTLEYKLGLTDITFIDLYNITNLNITITISNISDQKIEYWNHLTTPNNSVIDALTITSNIPLLFEPYKDNKTNKYYLDGSIVDHYPMSQVKDINKFIGICNIVIDDEKNINNMIENDEEFKLFKYIYKILYFSTNKNLTYPQEYLNRTIIIQNEKNNTPLLIDFNMSIKDRKKCIEYGYDITANFFN